MSQANASLNVAMDFDPGLVTIFLVEDDDADAKAIRRSLQKAKIANPVIRACDGHEALAMLRSNTLPLRFLMLIDINMPRMSGLELLSNIREDPALRKTVAFILTTSADDRDVSTAYSLNVAGYVVKDRVGEDFINLVDTLDGYWKIVELPEIG